MYTVYDSLIICMKYVLFVTVGYIIVMYYIYI